MFMPNVLSDTHLFSFPISVLESVAGPTDSDYCALTFGRGTALARV